MSTSPPTDPPELVEILSRVRSWPPRQRLALARRVLETLETPEISEPPRRMPIDRVFGLLKSDRPAPTDEECRRIVEEERTTRHLR